MGEACEIEAIMSVKRFDPILVCPEIKTDDGYYFLCNLDQNIAVIMQTVYCYEPSDKDSKNVADVLRQALARVLSHFYPLAGRLTLSPDMKLIVRCTNEGVPFVDAVADCKMEVLGDITVPDPPTLGKLLHTIHGAKSILEIPLLTAQVTRFKCGGFVLGVAMNHCMTDGLSALQFLDAWTETARGMSLTTSAYIDRSFLRARQPPCINYSHNEFMEISDISNMTNLYQEEPMVYRSFEFDPEKIAKLKKIAMEDGVIKSCTSFVALAAFLWRARSKALKMKSNQQTKLLFAVDGRSKFDPPMPKGLFGNGIVLACCLCTAGELVEKPLSFAVEQVQNSIKMVTEDFIRSAIDYFEVTRARPSLTATLLVTSWTRLSFNSIDFGWGKPSQSGCGTLPEREVALFLPTGKDKTTTMLLGLPVTAMKSFQELIQVK
ncbi:hypothetical protein RJ641_015123 [Dillenia turbinata]|uniref:Omega-hydroxypalmitate O-feruloyl transferase n=1 Tax=Dillenia turbinata TaxID=194707 RepID=A0AAN8UU68_9MAGN